MSYTVLASDILTEMQEHLLENPNGGDSWDSGLYTSLEVRRRLDYRLMDFYKRTGIVTKRDTTLSTTADQRNQNYPNDLIDIIRIGYSQDGAAGQSIAVPRGSSREVDWYVNDVTDDAGASVAMPYIFTLELAPVLQFSLVPAPANAWPLDFAYIPYPNEIVNNDTVIECPDDFTPFVKYGALADLFGKSGEVLDPVRQDLCTQLYELGIEAAQSLTAPTTS
jgi:hypothetical protein